MYNFSIQHSNETIKGKVIAIGDYKDLNSTPENDWALILIENEKYYYPKDNFFNPDNLNTSKVTIMKGIFSKCNKAASFIDISRKVAPDSIIKFFEFVYVLSLVPKPGIVMAITFFKSISKALNARIHTKKAKVESLPPDIPITAFGLFSCNNLLANAYV